MVGSPGQLAAQEGDPTRLKPSGLLRTGFEFEPQSANRNDGFIIYEARLGLSGEVGFVFDYELGIEYDRDDAGIDLLDAILSFPLGRSSVRVDLGGFRSPLSREATADKASLPLVERSQSALALAPGRQVGIQFRGEALDARLNWAAGLFNGNGLRLENDDDSFLGSARVVFNSVGEVEFFEDFVIEAGASLAATRDGSQMVLPVEVTEVGPAVFQTVDVVDFAGDRVIYGVDARVAYRGWTVAGEYLRTQYEFEDGSPDVHADGVSADLRYMLWGAFDLGIRYDSFRPAVVSGGGDPDRNEFLVFGLGVAPGLYAQFGMQYALGLDGSTRGVEEALDGTNTAPALTDGQFLMFLQVAF
jgi:phosphate-selective porin